MGQIYVTCCYKKVVLKNIQRNNNPRVSQYLYYADFEPKDVEVIE